MSMPRENVRERGEIGADRIFLRRQSTSVCVDTRPLQIEPLSSPKPGQVQIRTSTYGQGFDSFLADLQRKYAFDETAVIGQTRAIMTEHKD